MRQNALSQNLPPSFPSFARRRSTVESNSQQIYDSADDLQPDEIISSDDESDFSENDYDSEEEWPDSDSEAGSEYDEPVLVNDGAVDPPVKPPRKPKTAGVPVPANAKVGAGGGGVPLLPPPTQFNDPLPTGPCTEHAECPGTRVPGWTRIWLSTLRIQLQGESCTHKLEMPS